MFTLPENMADHPRFGRNPRVTGFVPHEKMEGHLPGWKYDGENALLNTGIKADVQLQHGSAIPIYVYYDVVKSCKSCSTSFLFFAEEQRHWYEHLGLSNDLDCTECVPCRRKQKSGPEALQREYQHLLGLSYDPASVEQADWRIYLDLASIALDLFAVKKLKSTSRIHHYMDQVPDFQQHHLSYRQAQQRLAALEEQLDQELEQAYGRRFESTNDDDKDEAPEMAA